MKLAAPVTGASDCAAMGCTSRFQRRQHLHLPRAPLSLDGIEQ